MGKNHKHDGVASKGILKSHPISRKHKDKKVQKYHVMSLKQLASDEKYGIPPSRSKKVSKKKSSKKASQFREVFKGVKDEEPEGEKLLIDGDGYIAIDMNKIDAKGIRIIGPQIGKIWFADKGKIKGIQFDK